VEAPVATSSKRFLAITLLALSCLGSAQSKAPADSQPVPKRMLIVQNYYYALPGKATDVYLWRLHASDIRAKLGLARGRVLRRVSDSKTAASAVELPDVIWECVYDNPESRAADVARLDKSPEFAEVEKHMDTLIRDFRRVMFEAAD
jgi:hypothetical protein